MTQMEVFDNEHDCRRFWVRKVICPFARPGGGAEPERKRGRPIKPAPPTGVREPSAPRPRVLPAGAEVPIPTAVEPPLKAVAEQPERVPDSDRVFPVLQGPGRHDEPQGPALVSSHAALRSPLELRGVHNESQGIRRPAPTPVPVYEDVLANVGAAQAGMALFQGMRRNERAVPPGQGFQPGNAERAHGRAVDAHLAEAMRSAQNRTQQILVATASAGAALTARRAVEVRTQRLHARVRIAKAARQRWANQFSSRIRRSMRGGSRQMADVMGH